MTKVRTLLMTFIVLALATTASAQPKALGLGAGVIDGEFSAQLRRDFWLGGEVSQITGQAGISFASKAIFRLDADYHFVLNADKPSRFYPLAGLEFAFTSDHVHFGVNVGGGLNFRLTQSMDAFAEVKYIISGNGFDGWFLMGGIYF
jgi:hypothetical protein